MNEQIKRLAGDAIAHARNGHAVNLVVPNREAMVELVKACKATGRFDKETRRITVGGGSIQFIAAKHIAVQQAKEIGAPWPHCTSVLFIVNERLPAGMKRAGDVARNVLDQLDPALRQKMIEGDWRVGDEAPAKKPAKSRPKKRKAQV